MLVSLGCHVSNAPLSSHPFLVPPPQDNSFSEFRLFLFFSLLPYPVEIICQAYTSEKNTYSHNTANSICMSIYSLTLPMLSKYSHSLSLLLSVSFTVPLQCVCGTIGYPGDHQGASPKDLGTCQTQGTGCQPGPKPL